MLIEHKDTENLEKQEITACFLAKAKRTRKKRAASKLGKPPLP